MNKEFKYIKDHKTGERFYPVVRSKGIVDAFSVNDPQIDMLFSEVTSYSIAEPIESVKLQPGENTKFTLRLNTTGPIDEADIIWASSNPKVATVDQSGYVETFNEGATDITADSDLYGVHVKVNIQVRINKLSGWTITYKSDVEVPNVWELVPETFREKVPYHYSAGATYNQIASQLNCRYKGSSYDDTTKTGQWVYQNPDISVLYIVYAYDQDAMKNGESFRPTYAAQMSANTIAYGQLDSNGDPVGQPVQVTQDYSSITSLAYGDGPTILACQGLDSDIYPNLAEIILPSTLTTLSFSTGLLGNSLYRKLPSVVEGMDYTFNVHKNISNISLTKWSSDAYPSNLGPGYEFSVFKYITVDPENPIYDSRENCNAIIETATNTLIAGCCNTTIPSSVSTIYDTAFARSPYEMETLVIPSTITSMGNGIFAENNIKNVIWESSVAVPHYCFYQSTIGSISFTEYTQSPSEGFNYANINTFNTGLLTTVIFGDTTISNLIIGPALTDVSFSYSGCKELQFIQVDSNNSIYNSSNDCNCLIQNDSGALILGSLNSTIPDTVTSIQHYAFSRISGLSNIEIPVSVTSIGYGAFYYCKDLTTITYRGTMNQWKSISKNDSWKYGSPITTINCSDGTITA